MRGMPFNRFLTSSSEEEEESSGSGSAARIYTYFVNSWVTLGDVKSLFEKFGTVVQFGLHGTSSVWYHSSYNHQSSSSSSSSTPPLRLSDLVASRVMFLLYSSTAEADRAIQALHIRHTFFYDPHPMRPAVTRRPLPTARDGDPVYLHVVYASSRPPSAYGRLMRREEQQEGPIKLILRPFDGGVTRDDVEQILLPYVETSNILSIEVMEWTEAPTVAQRSSPVAALSAASTVSPLSMPLSKPTSTTSSCSCYTSTASSAQEAMGLSQAVVWLRLADHATVLHAALQDADFILVSTIPLQVLCHPTSPLQLQM